MTQSDYTETGIPNFELIDQGIDFAEAGQLRLKIEGDGTFELTWDQNVWAHDEVDEDDDHWHADLQDDHPYAEDGFCKTNCCLFGYVVIAAGYQPIEKNWGDWSVIEHPATLDRGDVDHVARRLLNVSRYEAERLAAGGNEVNDLKRARDRIAEDHGVEPRWPDLPAYDPYADEEYDEDHDEEYDEDE